MAFNAKIAAGRFSQRLGTGEVSDVDEGVIQQGVGDACFLELESQAIMAVEIELQTEGGPGGHPEVAQAQLRMYEVEVVMQAFGIGGLKHGLSTGLVMPGPERGARLHSREDVDQARVVSAGFQNLVDTLFLTKSLAFADELDFQPVLLSDGIGIVPDDISQGLSKVLVVKDANLVLIKEALMVRSNLDKV